MNDDSSGLPSEWTIGREHAGFMTARRLFLRGHRADALLELLRVSTIGIRLAEQIARLRQSLERIEAVIEQSRQQHCQRLWLAVCTLRAVKHVRPALLHREARIERIEWPYSGRDGVRALRIDAEGGSAVLPEDTSVAGDDAAAPIEISALQDADAVSLRVGGRKINRVAGAKQMRPVHRLR